MLEAVVQLLFSTVVLFFAIEILVTGYLGYKMVRRAYLNHLSDTHWRLLLLSVGSYLMADAFNDSFWALHLTTAEAMRRAPEFYWSLLPAVVVSTAAMFMAYAFWTRSSFFEDQIAAKPTKEKED